MIRLGVCTSPENIRTVAELGFDYLEASLSGLAALSDGEFEQTRALVLASPIRVEAANGMLPGTLKVTGPMRDPQALSSYLDKAFRRAAELGVKTVVFGSGAARAVPADWPFEKAWREIADYLRLCEFYCERYDIDVAIEPLRIGECNILNYVSEAVAISSLLALPRIGALGDSYHMACGHEPFEALTRAGGHLFHVHLCRFAWGDPSVRTYPFEGDGSDHEALFAALRAGGYDRRVSVEAGCKDLVADGRKAFELLNRLRSM